MEQQSTQRAPTPTRGTTQEDAILVQLIISGGDAEGVRWYTERLPISVVRGLLDPDVDDFFLPIEGSGRSKLPGSRTHYLHTSTIREIILLAPLPAEA